MICGNMGTNVFSEVTAKAEKNDHYASIANDKCQTLLITLKFVFSPHNLDLFHQMSGRHISFNSRLALTMSGRSWSSEETPNIFMVISTSSARTGTELAKGISYLQDFCMPK